MPTIALHIIARDENDKLKNIISRYSDFFDEIVIAYDDDKAIEGLSGDKLKLLKYEWIDDFAHKRNFVVSNTTSDYYFRLDTDDVIIGVENVKDCVTKAQSLGVDIVMCEYIYYRDEDGNCTAKHWRETIIKTKLNGTWNKPVHENILFDDGYDYKTVRELNISIIHNTDKNHCDKSGERNLNLLMKEFNKTKENTDPRTIAYIGRMLLGMGQAEKAIPFLQLLVQKSGWDDDVYFAWIDLSRCYQLMQKYDIAVACCNEAMALNVEFPDAYCQLCEIYLCKKDYTKSIHWGTIALTKKEPNTNFVIRPDVYNLQLVKNLAISLFYIGEYAKAFQFISTLKTRAPQNTFVTSSYDLFQEALHNDTFVKTFFSLAKQIKSRNPDLLENLALSIPDVMLQDERLSNFKNSVLPPKQWTNNSVVIYCGNTVEEWGPVSVVGGIGGSEEAVIYLSRELAKIGYNVTVYNNCGNQEGKYGNVEYVNFYHFNPRDAFNIVVSWRGNIFTNPLIAKQKIIWLHDVPDSIDLKNGDYDKVIVLSEYHKSLLPEYAKDKAFVSSNGINVKDFDIKEERNPYRMIYTSSYDRGLQHLLLNWKQIKDKVPYAELHIFYGWNTYDMFVDLGMRSTEFKDKMVELMKQDGIFEHGRVGHKKLARELAKSKFWVYPCHFEEISCISAMKAQAAGCIPICTNYGALAETVKDGCIVNGNASDPKNTGYFIEALISEMSNPRTINIDKEQFGWDKVAKQWQSELLQ